MTAQTGRREEGYEKGRRGRKGGRVRRVQAARFSTQEGVSVGYLSFITDLFWACLGPVLGLFGDCFGAVWGLFWALFGDLKSSLKAYHSYSSHPTSS